MEGTIVRKVDDRGFGFLRCNNTGRELFFHSTGCKTPFETLKKGQAVSFDEEASNKGPRAKNVEQLTLDSDR